MYEQMKTGIREQVVVRFTPVDYDIIFIMRLHYT